MTTDIDSLQLGEVRKLIGGPTYLETEIEDAVAILGFGARLGLGFQIKLWTTTLRRASAGPRLRASKTKKPKRAHPPPHR